VSEFAGEECTVQSVCTTLPGPEAEFKDKCSSTARSVIEPCLVKAGYEPCLRTGFFREIFLFQRHSVSITAQSVID
jgi:hypothetical protein